MKWFLAFVLVAVFVWYCAAYKRSQSGEQAQDAVAAASPTPTPVRAKQFAPKGVYFLLQRVSITTDSGIIGIDPGTKVTLVKDKITSLLVTDGQTQFEVTRDQVTNDMDAADAASKHSQASDAAVAESVRQRQEAELKAQKAQTEEAVREAQQHPTATPAPVATAAPLSNPFGRPGE